MSIFLDCFKNNGYDYLRIVDGKRFIKPDGTISNKRITIKNLGHLKKFDDGQGEGLLIRLREKFKNQTLDIGMSYNELYSENLQDKNKIIKNPVTDLIPKNIGYFFLDSLFNKLGISQTLREYESKSKIEYDLNGITKLLVFDRILHPSSKKCVFEKKDDYLFPITTCEDINQIYKALDVLDKKSKAVQLRMNTKIKQSTIGRNTDLTYYDVTNYYFETMYGDEDILAEEGNIVEKGLRKKGVSKENRKEPIVQMGLFIDNQGLPVSYKLFSGNTQDKTTLKNVLENDIEDMNLGKIIIVADNGMNTQENKYLIIEQGN